MILVKLDAENVNWRYGKWFKSMDEAKLYAKENNERIISVSESGSGPLVRDGSGFTPHFNHGLGMYIDDKRQYREELKRRGLVEAGNEKPDLSFKPKSYNYADDTVCELLTQEHKFTDSDINELKDTKNV